MGVKAQAHIKLELWKIWRELFSRFPEELVRQAFAQWWERMTAPQRAEYHGPSHVLFMWRMMEAYLRSPSFRLRVRILLHDTTCEPGAKDNERQTVEVGVYLLCLMGMGRLEARRIANGIMPTEHHIADSLDGEKLCDLDLLSLGLPRDRYIENTSLIRREHAALSDEEWRDMQLEFVRSMLNRELIYYTKVLRDAFEQRARDNLQADLELLLATV
jgi:predicted metal-dependent HD superfamily phosphohydrolase